MKPNKSLVVFLVLIARICSAGIVVQTIQPIESSELIDAAVNILTSCYGEHGPLGTFGTLPRMFLRKLWLKKPIPVILLDPTNKIWDHNEHVPRPVKPQIYLFIVSHADHIRRIPFDRWDQRRPNALAPVILLSLLPNSKNGCMRASFISALLLHRGFVNANMLCQTVDKEIVLISGSQYTNRAPYPWEFFEYFGSSRKGYFLFWRLYRTENEICLNLNYDKTKNLGGQTIDLIDIDRKSLSYRTSLNNKSRFALRLDVTENIWETLLHQINATSMVRYVEFKGIPTTFTANAIMVPHPLHLAIKIAIPGLQQSDIIVMRSRGNKTQLKKILGIVDIYTQYCVFVTLIITLLFFKYVANQHFIPGMLNIFRIMCNTGFDNLPDNVRSRIFLAGLFLCAVTIHGVFSANLASLLTTEIPIHLPQTVQELLDLEYTIFMDISNWVLYTNESYEWRIFPATENCISLALAHDRSSCIENKYYLLDEAALQNLSVSSKDLFVFPMGLVTADGWSLRKTVSTILLRMSSAHIIESLNVRVTIKRMEEYHAYKSSLTGSARAMRFDDLSFAFVILGIGLLSATICFIIEALIAPFCSTINKVRRYFCR